MSTDLDRMIASAMNAAPSTLERREIGEFRLFPTPEHTIPVDDQRLAESLRAVGIRQQERLRRGGLQAAIVLWPEVIATMTYEVGASGPSDLELSNAYWAAIEGQAKVLCGRSLSWRR